MTLPPFPKITCRLRRYVVPILAFFALNVVLTACYLPVRFDTEIEIDRAGYYKMAFDGYLAETTLYLGLEDGSIDLEDEEKRVEVIKRDILRDSSAKEFTYFTKGHFKMNWERSGDLLDSKMVTFLRRSAVIFQLKYVENSGYIVLESTSISKNNRERLRDAGLNMQGQLRVKSDMPMKSSNATYTKVDPKDKRFTWYVWDITSIMSKGPRAVFILE